MVFDLAAALMESMIVKYFEKDLKASIKAKMDQDAIRLDNYEELIAKAVRNKAKAGLRPSSCIRKNGIQVFRGS